MTRDMSNRRHCACLFEEISGPPVQYCSHHAMQRKDNERLTAQIVRHERAIAAYKSDRDRLQARVEELEGVRMAAKDYMWGLKNGKTAEAMNCYLEALREATEQGEKDE